MQIIMAVLSLALLMWPEPASAQKTYSVSVSRHSGVPELSEEDLKKILADASKLLQKDPGHVDTDDDVACNVTFTLKGPVRTFASPDKVVFGDLERDAMHRVDSHLDVDFRVKVIEEIRTCRGDRGQFHGCGFPPDFRSIIVVHPKRHTDGHGQPIANAPDHVLWAHEFGHLTGLGHRDQRFALMTACPFTRFSNVPDARVRVTRDECRCLLSGVGSCPLPPPFFGCSWR